jgi:hypothetical protein
MPAAPSSVRDAWRDTAVLAVLGVALVARLAVFAINHPFPPLDKDDSVYDQLAMNVLDGHGFSISTSEPYDPMGARAPGYPAFLALVYGVAGHETDAVRIVQIVLAIGTCLIVFLVAQPLLGRGAALTAMAIYAVWPAAVSYPSEVLTESNAALFLSGAVYAIYRCRDEQSSPVWPIVAALALYLATLTRPDYQLLVVFLVIALAAMAVSRRVAVSRGALAIACFAVLLVPVMIWNYSRFNRFIGLASGTGHTLLVAQLESAGMTGRTLDAELQRRYGAAFERAHHRKMTFIDNASPDEDPKRMRDFQVFLEQHPEAYLKDSLKRTAVFWGPRSWSDALLLPKDFSEYAAAKDYLRLGAKGALLACDAVLLGLAALGGLLSLRRWREFAPIIGVVVYATLIYGLVYAGARYRVPVLPLVSILTVVSLQLAANLIPWPRAARRESPEPCVVS